MANTIAIATGYDSTRTKETHRLGSIKAQAEANTWRTFARVLTRADGTVHVTVTRDGKLLHAWSFTDPETEEVS